MSATLTVGVAPQSKSLADQHFYRLWQGFGVEAVSEDQAFEILERTAKQEGNGAWSSATLLSLGMLGIVVREGRLYRRAETFPDLPEDDSNRHGTDVFNAALERQQAEERRKADVRDQERQRDRENSTEGRERRELIALITETVREVAPEVLREQIEDGRLTIAEAGLRQVKTELAELRHQLEGSRAAA